MSKRIRLLFGAALLIACSVGLVAFYQRAAKADDPPKQFKYKFGPPFTCAACPPTIIVGPETCHFVSCGSDSCNYVCDLN
jgi:hypothetical protein